jgi:hypothetical protein
MLTIVRTARRKTSFEVDFDKVDRVKSMLGTTTLTDTVDAALDEVLALDRRRQLVELLFSSSDLELHDDGVRRDAWR